MEKGTENNESSYFSAIQMLPSQNSTSVGLAFMDTIHKHFFVTEFIDSNSFSLLESALLQIRPSCCAMILPTDNIQSKRISLILESCEVQLSEVIKNYFSTSNLQQDITRLLFPSDSIKNHIEELRLPLATQALACLLSKWSILSDISFAGRSTLQFYNIENFLRLDKASFSALLILPRQGESNRRPTSLLGLLNKCKTSIATRKLEIWLSQPLINIEEITLRHDIVEALLLDNDLRHNIQATFLKKVPDLNKILSKFHLLNSGVSLSKSRAELEDIVKLYDCIIESQKLLDYLLEYTGIHEKSMNKMFIDPLKEVISGFQPFLQLIENTIDLKEAESGNYVISRTFDPKLISLANDKEQILSDMEYLRSQIEESIFSQGSFRKPKGYKEERELVKIIEDNTLGYVLRVTKKDQTYVQGQKEYNIIRINKAELLFTTHPFKNLVKRYEQCCSDYSHFQTSLVEKTLNIASTFWPVLEILSEILSSIDILASFALVASSSPTVYVRPTITTDGTLRLLGCRHAIMEAQNEQREFIPNDIEMIYEKSRMHIITGPNMGGKSTYIRQVALAALMCQIGCFVPCRSAYLPIFTQIMCRVGASDIQLKGISTFLAEMVEASTILKSADKRSLVIIDELGRGTSTFEGFGLAWAIAKYLLEVIQCNCLFATHFHEMGDLAKEYEGVVNSHVSAIVNNETSNSRLTFLYQIQDGSCDQSYGVEVAKMAGVPEQVVARAKQKSLELESAEQLDFKKLKYEDSEEKMNNKFKTLKNTIHDLFSKETENKFYQALSESIPVLNEIIGVEIND